MKKFESLRSTIDAVEPLPADIRKFGLPKQTNKQYDKLEDLNGSLFNIVITECKRTVGFTQNKFKEQILEKKKRYVMGLGVYKQLWKDPLRKGRILSPTSIKFNNVFRPYKGQDLTDKTLLIARTGGIGDLLFILPNLEYLKEKYPTCTIWLACGPQYHSMVEDWECVDEILDLPFLFGRLIKSDYHGIFEGVIERCKEAQTENAYKLFTRWLNLNLPDEKLIPKLKPKESLIKYCKNVLEQWGSDDFILVQLRASSPIRTPRPGFWINFLNKLSEKGHNIIITDAPQMIDQLDNLISNLNPTGKYLNFSKHSITLDYSIALASLAKCVVSTDSSLIHIAAALDVPAFGFYGPFPGSVRLTTYKNVDWIDAKASCAPCFIHGGDPCYNSSDSHSKCYDNIDLDDAINRIEALIK